MKRIAMIAACILISTSVGFSQDGKGLTEEERKKEMNDLTPEEKAEKRTQKLTTELSLTDEQAVKIKAINLAHIKEMDKIHEEMKALRKKAKEEREKTKNEIEDVLTDEQKEKFEAKIEEHKKKREEHKKEKCEHHQHH
ncbi:hypothetical protein K6119_06225 [Paracrocinitomix mangrovi]|uniref:hypothetical protein n=1 Tax=Paracrocinitomix mangrovi TaxID=2862509 RepID=UPI001C8D78CF|nr:hypothetical protein [Paracrocinitomix mangrovi]UKN03108.1 hypothetical protein K6119_06225 [Paracrocinitomix mangrovi]